jgi:hypothetical protein
MMEEYTKKVVKPEVKKEEVKELPIFQKRQHWCFRLNGQMFKFPTKTEAEKKYLELS